MTFACHSPDNAAGRTYAGPRGEHIEHPDSYRWADSWGCVVQVDIDNVLIPALAISMTAVINKDPMGSSTKTLINLYENQMNEVSKLKCMNTPAKCCKTDPSTCVIMSEEVKISPVGKRA